MSFWTHVLTFVVFLLTTYKSYGACLAPIENAGQMNYNTTDSIYEYCDGTNIKSMKYVKPPEVIGTLQDIGTLANVSKTAISGNYLYAITPNDTLTVVDISNPSSMSVVKSITDATNFDNPQGIKASGNYVYVGSSTGGMISVVDVSTPTNPTVVANITDNLFSGLKDLDLEGNYLYAVTTLDRVIVVDISTPTSPTIAGSITDNVNLDYCYAIDVVGNYAYVAVYNTDTLSIIDISNPASPTIVGSVADNTFMDRPTDVAILGNHAYLTSFYVDKVAIVNISNPTSPFLEGDHVTIDAAEVIEISGNAAIVSASAGDRVFAIDLTNPTSPVLGNNIRDQFLLSDTAGIAFSGNTVFVAAETSGTITAMDASLHPLPKEIDYVMQEFNSPRALVTSGNYAYLASSSYGGVFVFDISNPSSPTVVSKVKHSSSYDISEMDLNGNYLYTTGTNGSNVTVFDVTDPLNPAYHGHYSSYSNLSGARGIKVVGTYAYVVRNYNDGLSVVDVSDPAAPNPIGFTGNSTIIDNPKDVAISGNYAYVTGGTTDSVGVIDISIPAAPSIVASVSDASLLDGANRILIDGNYAYVTASGYDGVAIIDISNPLAPTIVGSIQDVLNLDNCQFMDKVGNTLYVNANKKLTLIDVTTPSAPSLIGSGQIGDGSTDMFSLGVSVIGNNAFVGVQTIDSLWVLDISTPTTPTYVTETSTILLSPEFIRVSGNTAFVTEKTTVPCIKAFDFTTVGSPSLVGSLCDSNFNEPEDMVIDGNYLYLTSYNSDRLSIIDISNPASMSVTGFITNSTQLNALSDIRVVGNYAYVSAYNYDGIAIIDVTNKAAPSIVGSVTNSLLNQVTDIDVSGNYLYATGEPGPNDCVVTVDVTTKTAPTVVGSVCDARLDSGNFNKDLHVVGNYVYVLGNGSGHDLVTIDVSTPATPTIASSWEGNQESQSAPTLEVSDDGKYLYLAGVYGITQFGLDLNSANPPALNIFSYNNLSFTSGHTSMRGLDVVGDKLYFVMTTLQGVTRLDLSSLAPAPSIISSVADPSLYVGSKQSIIDGNYHYSANTVKNGLTITDISDPNSPTVVSNFFDEKLQNTQAITKVGNYIYLGGSFADQFSIMDVTNPANPTFIGEYLSSTHIDDPKDIIVEGNYAFVAANRSDKLTVLDISNPVTPTYVTHIYDATLLNGINRIVKSGNYIYAGTGFDYITVIDVTNPLTPSIVGSVTDATLLDNIQNMELVGTNLYTVSMYTDCLTVTDVSTPSNPTIIGSVCDPVELNYISDVHIIGNEAFVSTALSTSRFSVIDISDPTNPTIKSTLYDTTHARYVYDFVIDNNKAFLVDENASRLSVLDLFPPPPSSGACATAGVMQYNTTNHVMEFCDGSGWNDMGARGSGGSGCSTPTAAEGALDYDSANNIYRFCDGSSWINI